MEGHAVMEVDNSILLSRCIPCEDVDDYVGIWQGNLAVRVASTEKTLSVFPRCLEHPCWVGKRVCCEIHCCFGHVCHRRYFDRVAVA